MPFELDNNNGATPSSSSSNRTISILAGSFCVGAVVGTNPEWVRLLIWEDTLVGQLGFMTPYADAGGIIGAVIWGLIVLLTFAGMLVLRWCLFGRKN